MPPPKDWPEGFVYGQESICLECAPSLLRLSSSQAHANAFSSVIEERKVHSGVQLRLLTGDHPLSNLKAKRGHLHRGVFASTKIESASHLGEYVGRSYLFDRDKPLDQSIKANHLSEYACGLKLGSYYFFSDPMVIANELAFVNDYRNLGPKANVAAAWIAHRGQLFFEFVTLCDVQAGDELLLDYGEDFWKR